MRADIAGQAFDLFVDWTLRAIQMVLIGAVVVVAIRVGVLAGLLAAGVAMVGMWLFLRLANWLLDYREGS